jgi:hydrophobic/amphiphilic exporter-1 (mainly G- bacteria), HAE1 family
MNACAPFIHRPIMTTLVMASICLFGAIGFYLLPVSDLPNVDYPTIMVFANLSGANPDTMAATVATPLEKEFSNIAGIDSMNSSSGQGWTRITIQFVLSRNIDAAAQDVSAAIARCARRMPREMNTPPSYRKVNPADRPFLFLLLTSDAVPMSALDEFAQTMIAQRISMVDGVAQVNVQGSQKYAVRIQLDPTALAARKIGIDEVAEAIGRQNVNMPLGSLYGSYRAMTVQSNGQMTEAEEFRSMLVTYRNGQPVRLRDLGTVSDSVENTRQSAWYFKNGARQRCITLAIQRQPGTNTVEVAKAVKNLLPSFHDQLPASVTLEVLRDASVTIEESARDVEFTLVLTLILVVMVIFLFLRNFSATFIPSLALPMSLIGTFAVMYLCGFSRDNLSLMALTLAVGFVVDDAIVMLENIVRHLEMGKSRFQAALDGSREIGFTIVSMTLSLAAVFIPVLFMGGIVGRLFREFSITIGAAVIVSGVVSLTLTPMLASRFLRDPGSIRHGVIYRASEAVFQAALRVYGRTLRVVLWPPMVVVMLVFSAGILVATGYLFMIMPRGFIPSEDRNQIDVNTEAMQGISYEDMLQHQMDLAEIIQVDPDVERFTTDYGGGNTGRFSVFLKDRRLRTRTADDIVRDLRSSLARVPGVRAMPSNPPVLNVGGRMSPSQYQVTLNGNDTTELYAYAADLENALRSERQLVDVRSDLQLKNPQLQVEVDRDRAMTRGLSQRQIHDALYYSYGTRQVSTIFTPNNDYQVIMELMPQYQRDPSVLSWLYVRSSEGGLVPLKAVMKTREDTGPLSVNHSGQLPSVTISFNLPQGVALSDALNRVREITRASMPAGIVCNPQGTAQAFETSQTSLYILLGLAIIVIYIVLGILYESFHHPITILSALPFAGFGALVTLYLFHIELSVYAFVGIVMLVGLVKKNGIMMVDFAITAQRQEGRNPTDAIHEACMIRFRPIMMTTMAALMAGLPIALGLGAGGESRQPLGLAVVGGLLFSQLLTLYVTPVFYVVMEWIHSLLRPASRTPAGAEKIEEEELSLA